MSGFSTYLDNLVIAKVFTGTDFATPSKYMALFSSDTGLEDNNPAAQQEVTGEGYARIALPNTMFSAPVGGHTQNTETFEYNIALEDWGIISHMAIMDSVTSGNVIAYGVIRNSVTGLPQPRIVYAGDQLVIRTGSTVIGLTNTPDNV